MILPFPGGDVEISVESPQVTTRTSSAGGLAYRVEHGTYGGSSAYFRTFTEALAFERSLTGWTRITNPDNVDGAEDAGAAANHGLTREEHDEWRGY